MAHTDFSISTSVSHLAVSLEEYQHNAHTSQHGKDSIVCIYKCPNSIACVGSFLIFLKTAT